MEQEDTIPSTQIPVDAIQRIEYDTVHKICSGQVVLSLAIAVKELVENAIDAEATIIDIHLKEYGSELIEVSDNGKGVTKNQFQALTLKHYTSKMRQFSDLENIGTLGFRGEALSSLCALSDLTVSTKHSSDAHGTKIIYDRNGKIVSEVLAAREQGTTICLTNLFSSLPVRQKEFLKNLKREFSKMCQLLYAYCLVCKGIKFTCSNTLKKGSKNIVVQTNGSTNVRNNIINVFTSKQIASLIEVEMVEPNDAILTEFGASLADDEPLPFCFEFLISGVTHGSGRSTADRQFFFINSRPCEPTKIVKLVNEIYKQYNSSQFPFVYLNVTSNGSMLVDVNVTPDKRQVFLEKEKVLLATIKASLVNGYKAFPSTFKYQNLDLSQSSTIVDFFGSEEQKRGLKRNASEGTNTTKRGSIMERFGKRSKTESDRDLKPKNSIFDLLKERNDSDLDSSEFDLNESSESLTTEENMCLNSTNKTSFRQFAARKGSNLLKALKALTKPRKNKVYTNDLNSTIEETEIICPRSPKKPLIVNTKNTKPFDIQKENITVIEPTMSTSPLNATKPIFTANESDVSIVYDSKSVLDISQRTGIIVETTLNDIKELIEKKKARHRLQETTQNLVKFRSEIRPEANKSAEEELAKQISKSDFHNMSVIGQFNLGFIITRLEQDLFIVDQHATDEKYNFEQLQANTIIESQVLVNPKPLELTAGNEAILIENEEIFKQNGFAFTIDNLAPGTKKVALTAIPLSKNVVFGKDDIDEMLFMLQGSNRTMIRPTRIRAMFASRACRKSVMIGKALTKKEMKKLVDHMGEIEEPWNCPHGRPTMRHVINLNLIQREN